MVSKKDLQLAEERLSDPLWRLNNLYQIVDRNGQRQTFKLNWAQEELYNNMWYFNLVLKARQLGISTFICLLFLDRCLFNSDLQAGVIAHTLEDAQQLFKRIKFAYDNLPEALKSEIKATNDSARELCFSNGSSLRTGLSMRGGTLNYLHVSEFGKISAQRPDHAEEIISGSLNTISAGQYVFIESTAEGKSGHFFEMCREARALSDQDKKLSKLDFRFFFFPWHRCPDYVLDEKVTISEDLEKYFESLRKEHEITLTQKQKGWYAKKQATQFDNMLREFPSTPDESFQSATDGCYYARQLSLARMEGRISKVYYSEELPVHTAWDIGYGDSTAIWLFQIEGQEIHLIDYIENSNEPLTYYLKLLKQRGYVFGKHLVPHDAAAHEYGSGLTRIEIARKNGFAFTLVPDISIDEGIDAVRHLFVRCWFDEVKCQKGIMALDNYKRAWNKTQGCWSSHPLHNDASHGSDAFRMLAVGYNRLFDNGLSQTEIDRLYEQNNPRFVA